MDGITKRYSFEGKDKLEKKDSLDVRSERADSRDDSNGRGDRDDGKSES